MIHGVQQKVLVQKERAYYNATKDFQEEAKKNEQLLEKLRQ